MKLDEFIEEVEEDIDLYNHFMAIVIEQNGNIVKVKMGHTNTLIGLAKENGTYYNPPTHENYYAHALNMTGAIACDYGIQLYYKQPTKEQLSVLDTLSSKNFLERKLIHMRF